MSAELTLTALKAYCRKDSGDEQIWVNKGTTYHWNRGKDTAHGMINGVVRKLAGIDASGHQIWVVAGSIKISTDGTVIRFTGMPKKTQKLFEGVASITATAEVKTLETV
jgi:hypothetical protein